jgi:hypothetical protein
MSHIELQPRYKILINGVDVTSSVSGDVNVEDNTDYISMLTFDLSGRDFLLKGESQVGINYKDVVKMHDSVYMEGGAGPLDSRNYKAFFKGFVKYVRPQYDQAGVIKVALECVGDIYRTATAKNYFIYPSSNNQRTWGRGAKIKSSEIVRNLIKEIGAVIGKAPDGSEDIKLSLDKEWSSVEPITQKNESDWQVLKKLAERLNCNVWSTFNGLAEEIHFVDRGVLRGGTFAENQLVFAFPLRTSDSYGFDPLIRQIRGDYIYIRDVNIEQDFAAMDEVKKTITVFNYETGEEVNIFEVKLQENGKEVVKYYTFEIDEDKVAALSPEARKELEKVAYSIAGDEVSPHSIQEIAPYFKPAKFYSDRNFPTVDKPYFGITLTCVCDGDVRIISRRNYRVLGVGRYGSNSIDQNYYLKSVKHIWNNSGYSCELNFVL